MQFFFGLGNPGSQYQHTRHNAGFLFVDEFLKANKVMSAPEGASKFQAEVWKLGELIVAKPQTFMNLSGQAVRSIIEYYDKSAITGKDAELPQLWVAFDDLDIPVGQSKIQFGTGPKVHNGLNSIYEHIGTTKFWHVRLGVDGRAGDRSIPSEKYVLASFTSEEQPLVREMFSTVTQTMMNKLAPVQ